MLPLCYSDLCLQRLLRGFVLNACQKQNMIHTLLKYSQRRSQKLIQGIAVSIIYLLGEPCFHKKITALYAHMLRIKKKMIVPFTLSRRKVEIRLVQLILLAKSFAFKHLQSMNNEFYKVMGMNIQSSTSKNVLGANVRLLSQIVFRYTLLL